ncbi:hypothetical protein [Thioalkalivibrio sp. ALJ15]|uniref:hypothetical protein n=1 Tax=Thioalkalivibrio sp. ALJ15 TaxID=748652 RepID=UPI00036D6DF2|nr:hypothetical protein [Thioalkalivibrio sp. ALJ15]
MGKVVTLGASTLQPWAERLAQAIAAHVRPDTGLWDPIEQAPSPADHYGQTSATLALYLQGGPEMEQWGWPLRAWLTRCGRHAGHAPFNRLLLLLLRERVIAGVQPVTPALETMLDEALQRCHPSRHYPSNNWTLLAQLCRLVEARPGRPRDHAAARLAALLERWTTASGGFIDYPARPGPRGVATPMAYHHKALLIASIALCYAPTPALATLTQRLYGWVALTWDGGEYAGGLGRSTHSLFGDACLVGSLDLLGLAGAQQTDAPAGQMLRGVLARWERQRRGDGLLGLTPADRASTPAPGNHPAGWDNYMHLSVYNAWAAAVLAWVGDRRRREGTPEIVEDLQWAGGRTEACQQDLQAGVLCARAGPDLCALISTRGQAPQAFSRDVAELRYAGGQPFHIRHRDRVLCPPAVRVEAEALLRNPALAGWVPLFRIGDQLWALAEFRSVTVDAPGAAVRVRLEDGHAVPVLRAAARTLWRRGLAALDWRWFGGAVGRGEALRRPRSSVLFGRITFWLDPAGPTLRQEVALECRGEVPVHYLNPGGHALVVDNGPSVRRFQQQDPVTGQWTEVLFPASGRSIVQIPLPSTIPGLGCALPPKPLPPGPYAHRLTLGWSD